MVLTFLLHRPGGGAVQVYVAVHDGVTSRACRVHLSKGARSRLEEDAVASRLVLRALASGCGLDAAAQSLDLGLLRTEQQNGAADGAAAGPTFEQLQACALDHLLDSDEHMS